MSSYQDQSTKLTIAQQKETVRVANNLAKIISREVIARNPAAIAFLAEAMKV